MNDLVGVKVKIKKDELLNSSFDYALENYKQMDWIDQFRYGVSVTQVMSLR